MTKIELMRPSLNWDINAFFEGQGYSVRKRAKTSDGYVSVILNEDLTTSQRSSLAAALKADGCSEVESETEPAHVGSTEEVEEAKRVWLNKPNKRSASSADAAA
jgi:hypothetical protein